MLGIMETAGKCAMRVAATFAVWQFGVVSRKARYVGVLRHDLTAKAPRRAMTNYQKFKRQLDDGAGQARSDSSTWAN